MEAGVAVAMLNRMLDARSLSALQPWRHNPLWGWGNPVFSVTRATTPIAGVYAAPGKE